MIKFSDDSVAAKCKSARGGSLVPYGMDVWSTGIGAHLLTRLVSGWFHRFN